MVDVFKELKLELLALMEMKLKGNGEVPWCSIYGIIAGVQEMERDREEVANGHPVERCVAQCSGKLWVCFHG